MGKKKKKRKETKGKRKPKHTKSSTKHKMYKVEGNKLMRKKTCPKCGSGVFLAEHKTRSACGRCHYTEFKKSQ